MNKFLILCSSIIIPYCSFSQLNKKATSQDSTRIVFSSGGSSGGQLTRLSIGETFAGSSGNNNLGSQQGSKPEDIKKTKVTFRVDMRKETVSPNGVHVPGNYQQAAGMVTNWNPADALVIAQDPDNDKIFELQVSIPPGTYEFKYVNGDNWSGAENVPSPCNVNGNRSLTVGATDMVLNVVCFSGCTNTSCIGGIVNTNNSLITVFPNPTHSNVIITAEGVYKNEFSYRIFDYLGNELQRSVSENNKAIADLSSLNSGVYFLLVYNPSNAIIYIERIVRL